MSRQDHHLEIERPYKQEDPLDMDDARKASRRSSQLRRDAEADLRQAINDRAEKEGRYRKLLAKEIVRKRAEHAATLAVDLAKGEDDVRAAMIDFRIAEGMVDAHKERLKTIEGDRSQLKSLIDWSAGIANILREQPDQPVSGTHGTGRPRAVA